MRTFAELYCEQHQIPPENFRQAVFWRSLARRAWLLAPFIFLLKRDFFAADFEFVARIGRVTTAGQLREELNNFRPHPWHDPFLRRVLKIRVSGRRAARLVTAAWQASGAVPSVGSANPHGAT